MMAVDGGGVRSYTDLAAVGTGIVFLAAATSFPYVAMVAGSVGLAYGATMWMNDNAPRNSCGIGCKTYSSGSKAHKRR